MARSSARQLEPAPPSNLIRLRARPDTFHVTRGRTALETSDQGFVEGEPEQGLLAYETRFLSRYIWRMNGEQPQRVALSHVRQHTSLGYYVMPAPGAHDAAQHSVELRLSRFVGDGFHEDVDLVNHNQKPVSLELELELDADFADLEEVQDRKRRQRGDLRHRWLRLKKGVWELDFDYRVSHRYAHQGERGIASLHRGVAIRIERAGSPPSYRNRRIRFKVRLAPHGNWHACVIVTPILDGDPLPSRYGCYSFVEADNAWERRSKIFLAQCTHFATQESASLANVVVRTLDQAKRDLDSLRLHDLDRGTRAWTVAAGVPTYLALFGRDTLTAGWQASLLGPEAMRGALHALPPWQGHELNPWRDEQPGRMLHEAHSGPLAVLNFSPKARYYGGVTASLYYPTVVAALWHWTGDKSDVAPFIEPALRGLAWADRYSRRDDGFYYYDQQSKQGLKNQGWKDSGDAIVYPDGSQVPDPIATCEMQAYVYVSKLHFSEVLWWLGRTGESQRLFEEAEELKRRFNRKFWMDDEQFYCMGLDGRGRQIRSIGSDPGHCLASGIVPRSRARAVARRLMQPDLFSGWGIRTLSANHPAFNPSSYHRGSVWPVENATFMLAFVRFGLYREMERLCRALFETASLFDFFRLPEVLSGHPRDRQHPFPALYPRSDWPQAWSSAAVFTALQSMLGLFAYAPLKMLVVNPNLPAWLPEITLEKLRVGTSQVSIRFFRGRDGRSDYEVVDRRGTVHVVRQPSPFSLTASGGERLRDLLSSLLPGK
jgi:glycogen debranching enzyme